MTTKFGDRLLELYPRVLSFALSRTGNRADAEDLVQSTLIRALERKNQLDVGSLEGWEITIANIP